MKKKLWIGLGIVSGVILLGGFFSSISKLQVAGIQTADTAVPTVSLTPTSTITSTSVFSPIPTVEPTLQPTVQPTTKSTDSGLSNDNTYVNSYGNTVHSPTYANSVPQGATAQCNDGTYSFSQHRQGTCSHHGGVAQWL